LEDQDQQSQSQSAVTRWGVWEVVLRRGENLSIAQQRNVRAAATTCVLVEKEKEKEKEKEPSKRLSIYYLLY
jgi:hypothetical protein